MDKLEAKVMYQGKKEVNQEATHNSFKDSNSVSNQDQHQNKKKDGLYSHDDHHMTKLDLEDISSEYEDFLNQIVVQFSNDNLDFTFGINSNKNKDQSLQQQGQFQNEDNSQYKDKNILSKRMKRGSNIHESSINQESFLQTNLKNGNNNLHQTQSQNRTIEKTIGGGSKEGIDESQLIQLNNMIQRNQQIKNILLGGLSKPTQMHFYFLKYFKKELEKFSSITEEYLQPLNYCFLQGANEVFENLFNEIQFAYIFVQNCNLYFQKIIDWSNLLENLSSHIKKASKQSEAKFDEFYQTFEDQCSNILSYTEKTKIQKVQDKQCKSIINKDYTKKTQVEDESNINSGNYQDYIHLQPPETQKILQLAMKERDIYKEKYLESQNELIFIKKELDIYKTSSQNLYFN